MQVRTLPPALKYKLLKFRSSSVGRAIAWKARGQWFDSIFLRIEGYYRILIFEIKDKYIILYLWYSLKVEYWFVKSKIKVQFLLFT